MAADYAEYNENGIYFAYPMNWTLQTNLLEEFEEDIADSVVVTDPNGSFWLIATYPPETSIDKAAKKILKTMMSEYKKLESEPIKKYIGTRVLTGYEMRFFFLDLTNTALVLGFKTPQKTYIIYWQTYDRLAITDEKFCCQDVFEAITHTLLEHLDV